MDSLFYRTGYGWITPKGTILVVHFLEHLNYLREFVYLEENIRELFDQEDDAIKNGNSYSDLQLILKNLMNAIYDSGYIRIAVKSGVLEAEGIRDSFLSRTQLLYRLKEQYEQENNTSLELKFVNRPKSND